MRELFQGLFIITDFLHKLSLKFAWESNQIFDKCWAISCKNNLLNLCANQT